MSLMPQHAPMPKQAIGPAKGGRPLLHTYLFAPRDGDLYPSKSPIIQRSRVRAAPQEGDEETGWQWALSHARLNDLWMVVPLHGTQEPLIVEEVKGLRSSIHRSARRLALSLVTERHGGNLYVYAQDK